MEEAKRLGLGLNKAKKMLKKLSMYREALEAADALIASNIATIPEITDCIENLKKVPLKTITLILEADLLWMDSWMIHDVNSIGSRCRY